MRTFWGMVALFVAAPSVSAQEKAKLEVRSRKGEKYTVVDVYTNRGAFKMKMGEQEQSMELSEDTVWEYADEVIAVDADGWPTEVRRTVTRWREKEKGPFDEAAQEKKKSLEGKTFSIVRKGNQSVIEGVKDVPAGEAKKNRLRRPIFVSILPKGEVAVGTTWEVPEAGLKEEFQEDMADDDTKVEMVSAKGKGTFQSLKGTIATVVYDLRFEGKMQGGAKMEFTMTVTATIDVKEARLARMAGDGKIKLSGSMEQEGQKVEVSGGFAVKGERKYAYAGR